MTMPTGYYGGLPAAQSMLGTNPYATNPNLPMPAAPEWADPALWNSIYQGASPYVNSPTINMAQLQAAGLAVPPGIQRSWGNLSPQERLNMLVTANARQQDPNAPRSTAGAVLETTARTLPLVMGGLGAAGVGFLGGAGAGAAAGLGDVASGYGISPGFIGSGAGGLFGASGAPSTLAGLGGGGASGFGAAAAGAVNAGTAGLGALGGVGAGLGVGSVPAAGLGGFGAEGVGAGLGAGSVPAAGAGMAGWGPAIGTVGGGPPVAAASGLSGALGSLGLPGWLTVGSLAAGALQGNKDQTTTTTNAPPAYIAPYLSQAAGAASDQYGQGAYVSPLQQAAVGYGTNVLNGSYLNSNPYLDATFNRAAGAVTNQVQSNFGTAGRNVRGPDAAGTAQYGAAGAGGGYDDLANLIYGGNYQAERNRQQQILPMTNDLGRIGNPSTALDDYIARLRNISGGYGSTTSSTPTQSNLYSGLAGLGLALIPGG